MVFDETALTINPERETDRICRFISSRVFSDFKRKGVVVGLSGGVDSALLACLCVRALGAENVVGLLLPERESAAESAEFAREQASELGIRTEVVDITSFLESFDVYERRNAVIRGICHGFEEANDDFKIMLPPDLLERDRLNVFSLVVTKASGERLSFRLGPEQLRSITAAQNIKQRTRMIQLYYLAEVLHFVVGGTTNRTEMEQGFFVKHGDGAVDVEPLAHLYKTQVFQLAEHVGVIDKIRDRPPTPDTWPGRVTDQEFFFRIPYETLDLLLFAWNEGYSPEDAGHALGFSSEVVSRAYRDFRAKKNGTWHLRMVPPNLLEDALNPEQKNRTEDLA